MIVGFSTSSPLASVWVFDPENARSWSKAEDAKHAASGACLAMLQEGLAGFNRRVSDVRLFLADLGPGSFTGTRVGVTLAKTLAYAVGGQAGGASAFDLIDAGGVTAVPSKRGEWFVRVPGEEPYRSAEVPKGDIRGYGWGLAEEQFPSAINFGLFHQAIPTMDPEFLVPAYLIEPSISLPKKPFGVAHGR